MLRTVNTVKQLLKGRVYPWMRTENKLGQLDPEIYPTVVVSLGTAAWGLFVLLRKARTEFPPPF